MNVHFVSSDTILAYHMDLTRAMWTVEYLLRMATRLRAWGFNAILLEIGDKFRFRNHPALAHPEAMHREELRQFVRDCEQMGIEVIPLCQTLGHAEQVLSKPQYARLREDPARADQYDPTSDEARRLILELCDELMDAAQPRRFFHVGGDETWQLGQSARCAPLVREIGKGGLYWRHMRPILEHVARRGLRPMLWADMVLSHPELLAELSKHVVLVDWDYWSTGPRVEKIVLWGGDDRAAGTLNRHVSWTEYRQLNEPGFRRHLERFAVDEQTTRDGSFVGFYCAHALADAGFDLLTASAARSHGSSVALPRYGICLPNCFHSARVGRAKGLGTIVTSWAVRHNHPELNLPAAFAAASALRADEAFDFDAIVRAFGREWFGVDAPELAGALRCVDQPFPFTHTAALQEAQRALAQGNDPLAGPIASVQKWHGGTTGAPEFLRQVIGNCERAAAVVREVAERAERHADSLAFWLEGIKLTRFYAEFLFSALRGTLREDRAALGTECEGLEQRTRELFATTYCPGSVADELALRYGFHRQYLNPEG
jgi:hypothetical protein